MPESIAGQFQLTLIPTIESVDEFIQQFPKGSNVFLPSEYFAVILDYFTKMGYDTSRVPGGTTKRKVFTWDGRKVEQDPFDL